MGLAIRKLGLSIYINFYERKHNNFKQQNYGLVHSLSYAARKYNTHLGSRNK